MKKLGKILAIVLAIATLGTVLCFSLVACNKDNNSKILIGVQAGTTGESFVSGDADWGFSGIPNSKASAFKYINSAITDMENGNLDYIVVDKAVAEKSITANMKIIPIDLTVESYAIGVNKNKTQLLTDVNSVIATITTKQDGQQSTLEKIYAAYDGIAEGAVPAVETGFTGVTSCKADAENKLIIACNAEFNPYEYKVGDKFYGIDMEIAKIIAETLKMNLYISDMDFDSVVTSVGSGDADLALSCLTVKEVRAKVVNFSTPYETGAAQVLIVKKDNTEFDNCKTVEDVMNVFKNKK